MIWHEGLSSSCVRSDPWLCVVFCWLCKGIICHWAGLMEGSYIDILGLGLPFFSLGLLFWIPGTILIPSSDSIYSNPVTPRTISTISHHLKHLTAAQQPLIFDLIPHHLFHRNLSTEPNMAALIIGCSAFLADRLSKKHRAKKERNAEYAANFESLKAENAKRVQGMSSNMYQNSSERLSGDTLGRTSEGAGGPQMTQAPPPGYEDARPYVTEERGRKANRSGRH